MPTPNCALLGPSLVTVKVTFHPMSFRNCLCLYLACSSSDFRTIFQAMGQLSETIVGNSYMEQSTADILILSLVFFCHL